MSLVDVCVVRVDAVPSSSAPVVTGNRVSDARKVVEEPADSWVTVGGGKSKASRNVVPVPPSPQGKSNSLKPTKIIEAKKPKKPVQSAVASASVATNASTTEDAEVEVEADEEVVTTSTVVPISDENIPKVKNLLKEFITNNSFEELLAEFRELSVVDNMPDVTKVWVCCVCCGVDDIADLG